MYTAFPHQVSGVSVLFASLSFRRAIVSAVLYILRKNSPSNRTYRQLLKSRCIGVQYLAEVGKTIDHYITDFSEVNK